MLVNKAFTDLLTFTRASSAWRFNASGILVQEAANTPRFDYDPVTLQPRGFLVEEAATNLCTYSADFSNAAWTKTGTSVTANAGLGPDGAMSLWKVVEAAASGSHGLIRSTNVTVAENAPITMWFVLKAGERRYGRVRLATNIGFLAEVRFDLIAGKIINSAGSAIGDLVPFGTVGSGLWLVSVTATTQAGSTNLAGAGAYFWDTATGGSGGVDAYAGDGVSGIYCFACQVEQRAFVTSFIQASATPAVRAADVASLASLSKIGINPEQGTLYVEAMVGALGNAAAASSFPHMVGLMKGSSISAGDYIGLRISQPDSIQVNVGNAGSFNSPSVPGGVTTVGAVEKLAAAGQGASITAARNGAVGSTLTSRTWPADVDTLWIGSQGGTTRFWNGWIRSLRYYPRRLSSAQLQALTA